MKRKTKARRTIRRKGRVADIGLGIVGLGLAVASLYFPWHIYRNQDAIRMPRLEFSGQGEMYGEPEDRIVPDSRAYVPLVAGQLLDPSITGSVVRDTPSGTSDVDTDTPQVLPEYRVLYSANGLALVRDRDSVFVVGTGTRLPEGGNVSSISRVDGVWRITTSKGSMIVGP